MRETGGIMFLKKYLFGDTAVYYAETPVEGRAGKTIGLAAYPKDREIRAETLRPDSLVQVAFTGDEGLSDYSAGVTMSCHSSALLQITEQTADRDGVTTFLTDGTGNDYTHFLRYSPETGVFSVRVRYENHTGKLQKLEKLASVSLGGICSAVDGDTRGFVLHRMTSAWSRECRLKSEPFSRLGLERSWANYGVKCERWGQVGSMPNRGYYPFAAIEDPKSGVSWGVTLEAPYSWQLELFGERESVTLAGGLADYEFGHWRKEIPTGGSFETHEGFFTVVKGSVNEVCNAFVHEADSRLCVPEAEEGMPVLFNEYCTTWGCPSAENIEKILTALKGLPIETFVIDCGWYKPDGKGWCNAIGDWKQSAALFPEGIGAVVREINRAGMRAGIWFEFEIAGRDSELFEREEIMLKRDGAVITNKNRRFLDLRKEETTKYLEERFLRFLKQNGFEYLKIDYNDAYGIGCDGAESYGEGGRQVAEASIGWVDRLRAECPGLVVENCASGGSRIEPLRMSKVAMCSFSDAHECPEIPLVAANVSRVVPARQMQIWAVLRENESDSRTVYSLCAAMLGRICLSGDVLSLTKEKRALIERGLSFYREIKDLVRYGDIKNIVCSVDEFRDPYGFQIYEKSWRNRTLVVVHNLQGAREIDCKMRGKLLSAYTTEAYATDGSALRINMNEFTAGAFLYKN